MSKTFKTKVDIEIPAQGAEYQMQTAAQKMADNAAANMQALDGIVESVSHAINSLAKIIEAQRAIESAINGQVNDVSKSVLEQTNKIKKSVVNNIPRTPIQKVKGALSVTKLKEAEQIGAANGEIIKAVTSGMDTKSISELKARFANQVRAVEVELHTAVNKAKDQLHKSGFKK